MIKARTVFIIGAGAGADINMPIGAQLAEDIAKRLDLSFNPHGEKERGDLPIARALHAHADHLRKSSPLDKDTLNSFRHAAWRIRDGIQTSDSIDDFIDRLKDQPDADRVELCGKVGIVRSILDREARCDLALRGERKTVDLNRVAHTWFMKLLRLLTRQHPDRRTLFDNVAFITFNYDRCLEHFLLNALQPAYGIAQAEAIEILKGAKIYHPYGTVGTLPPLTIQEAERVPFGGDDERFDRVDLIALAQRIRTYTERHDDEGYLEQIRHEVANAERLVFLGFAYHAQNVELITGTPGRPKQIFGTACGFSSADCDMIRNRLVRLYNEQDHHVARKEWIRLHTDLKCDTLFDHYGLTLAEG